ncbi:uncharacterized protein LOC134279070 [Saccostrea cucullata]|uniref:uncharacterized protein LOC134279070 n=1 Tax=Saccostrea cuccullata TaxID=36930 RepID=UPI002ED15077
MCLKRCHDNNLCLNVEYNKKQLRCKLLKDHDDGKETLLTQLRNVTKCQKGFKLSVCEEFIERVHFSSGELKCVSKEQFRNVALGKPANLSSVWDSYSEAFYAVDGRGVVPGAGHWYCAHSEGIEPHPYLRIDLQNLFYIDHILLLTRGDYAAERFHDVEVRVGHVTTWENMTTCGMFNEKKTLTDFDICNIDTIWLEINLKNSKPILYCSAYRSPSAPSCWAEDLAREVDRASCCDDTEKILTEQYRNVALRKPANLSSVWDNYTEAVYAVDGRGVVAGEGYKYCAHSDGREPHPHLRIDLQNLFYIDYILLITRGDINITAEYVHDVEVRVGHVATWENMTTCGMFNGTAEPGQTYKIQCASCLVGQFVTVRIVGDKMMHVYGGNQLSLCEVTVWGKRYYS